MPRRSVTLAGEVSANLAQLLIAGKPSVILVFGVALFSVMTNLISTGLELFLTPGQCLMAGVGLLAIFVLVVRLGLRWLGQQLRIGVIQEDNPAHYKALVIFLSPVGLDLNYVEDIVEGRTRCSIGNEEDRKKLKGSWRMPLEAIAYHLDRLETVVVLPSADSGDKAEDGTWRNVWLFVRLLVAMTNDQERHLRIICPHANGKDRKGVDFEDAKALVAALEDIYAHLREQNYVDSEILIDITGGQKVPTVAGATVALDVGRRIQYVSPRDYKLRAYDFTVSAR